MDSNHWWNLRAFWYAVVLMSAAVGVPRSYLAQASSGPFSTAAVGSRIRLFIDEDSVRGIRDMTTGVLRSLSRDSLVLETRGRETSLALSRVSRMEVVDGERTLALPVGIGASLAGGLLAFSIGRNSCGRIPPGTNCPNRDKRGLPAGVVGAAIGAVVGSVVGWFFRVDRWVDVQRVTPVPAPMPGAKTVSAR